MPIYDGNWPAYWQEVEWERRERARIQWEEQEEREQAMLDKIIQVGDKVWVEFKGEVKSISKEHDGRIVYTVRSDDWDMAMVRAEVITKEEAC